MRLFSPRWRGFESTLPRAITGVLLSLLAFAPVSAQAGCDLALADSTLHGEKIPDLKGCTVTQARGLLASHKLRIVMLPGATAAPADVIDTQSPVPGAITPSNRTVTVGVSNGGTTTPPSTTAADIQVAIVSKEAHSVRVRASIGYDVAVRNVGTARTQPVRVRLGLENFTVGASSGLPEGCATLPCNFGLIAPGAEWRFTVTGWVPVAGAFRLQLRADDGRDKPGRGHVRRLGGSSDQAPSGRHVAGSEQFAHPRPRLARVEADPARAARRRPDRADRCRRHRGQPAASPACSPACSPALGAGATFQRHAR